MVNWKTLDFSHSNLFKKIHGLIIPPIKHKVDKSIPFEDPKKELIAMVVTAVTAICSQFGLKIKYRGEENIRGRRLIFVSNHQGSTLDGFVLALLCIVVLNKLPYTPAGEKNLKNAGILAPIIENAKYLGSFFIRDSFDDEQYKIKISNLMDSILDSKQPILFFLEGSASKTGRPLPPKRGLIKSLSVDNNVFCPISITYENSPLESRNKSDGFDYSNICNKFICSKIGNVYVNFGECIDGHKNHYVLTKQISDSIYSEIPILTIDVVSTILKFYKVITIEDLEKEVNWLSSKAKERNIPYISKNVKKVLSMSSHFISNDDGLLKIKDYTIINYYANRAVQIYSDLSNPPDFFKYEFPWNPKINLKSLDERLVDFSFKISKPIVEIYDIIFREIYEKKEVEIKYLSNKIKNHEAFEVTTISNLLFYLKDKKIANVINGKVILIIK